MIVRFIGDGSVLQLDELTLAHLHPLGVECYSFNDRDQALAALAAWDWLADLNAPGREVI